jgi:CMP-N,N'-diacetyllegionaminic acid synthase
MKILAVVTARAGSKRLPGKNIAMLGGKPLIAWSIEVGLATCAKVVTTTDGTDIADIARRYGSDVVMRPPEIALGLPGMHLKSVLHAVDHAEGGPYDAVLLLQPTCPFRTADDVIACRKIMEDNNAESVISVKKVIVEDTFFKIGYAGRLRPAANEQDSIYTPNGAVYLTRTEVLQMEPPRGGWYGPLTYGYVMPLERSVDIDTHADFESAAAMLDADGNFAAPGTDKKLAAV